MICPKCKKPIIIEDGKGNWLCKCGYIKEYNKREDLELEKLHCENRIEQIKRELELLS